VSDKAEAGGAQPEVPEPLSLAVRSNLVLGVAQVLYVNGQSTDQVLAAAEQVGDTLGLRATIIPRWGELRLLAEDENAGLSAGIAADPVGVNMGRVASAMQVAQGLRAGQFAPAKAAVAIAKIGQASPAPIWLFTCAAGAGGAALAVLFGVQHPVPASLIFASAAAGAMLRRCLARYSANALLQPFCAALLAGVIGALAVRWDLSSSLRLVAVCPCMVLVPGPHVLNGMLDLVRLRITLGAARLFLAGMIILSITAGLLLGLAVFGVSLPVEQTGGTIPLWQDILAAGVAVASYSVFFSMPPRMFAWPVAVGMAAHAARWGALTIFGFGAAGGAFAACFIVGSILTPVARREHMPFAAIGFAAVVSMIPGVFLFRAGSGLLQLAGGAHPSLLLLSETIADGMTALVIILAMSFGLILPKMVIDWLADKSTRDVKARPP
jgi:uncharacterized membrane protein YjjB (DUF3815 family)